MSLLDDPGRLILLSWPRFREAKKERMNEEMFGARAASWPVVASRDAGSRESNEPMIWGGLITRSTDNIYWSIFPRMVGRKDPSPFPLPGGPQ